MGPNKLNLRKETLAELTTDELHLVHGAGPAVGESDNTCGTGYTCSISCCNAITDRVRELLNGGTA